MLRERHRKLNMISMETFSKIFMVHLLDKTCRSFPEILKVPEWRSTFDLNIDSSVSLIEIISSGQCKSMKLHQSNYSEILHKERCCGYHWLPSQTQKKPHRSKDTHRVTHKILYTISISYPVPRTSSPRISRLPRASEKRKNPSFHSSL